MAIRFIKHPSAFSPEFKTESPAPIFRRHFEVKENLVSAKLSIAALGFANVYLNGRKVTNDLFLSPMSDYRKTIWYTSYDVTELLKAGDNTAAAMLGNGFFNESVESTWKLNQANWRDNPALGFELELNYPGKTEYIESDTDWLCNKELSPIRFNEYRFAECFDANYLTNWMNPDLDDTEWDKAVIKETSAKLTLCPAEPVRECEVYNCVKMFENESGAYVFDFGQNISGYLHIKTSLPKGTKLRILYAEEIEDNGERRQNWMADPHYYKGLESQFSEVTTGEEMLDWKPSFSYYGFRYAIIYGFDTKPDPNEIKAVFVHQAVTETGKFECSDTMLDAFWNGARMASLSNLLHIQTDCPTREKLGWLNDAQASCEQMVQNYDMRKFYKKWYRDICDSMREDGNIPGVAPTPEYGFVWGNGPTSSGILFEIPLRMYQYYGDDTFLKDGYPYMQKHLEFLENNTKDDLVKYGLPDWAIPNKATNPMPVPLEFTCTLLMIKFLRIASLAAKSLGLDNSKHAEREKFYTESFKRHYINEDGRLTLTEQTASAMTIALGIGDVEKLKPQLLESLEKYNNHFNMGMLGMQYLFPALDICGFEEEGYKMLTSKGFPSFNEWFEKYDATTLHEMWIDNQSKNHHMFSCPIAWFHNTILGIRRDERFFTDKTFTLAPHFLKELNSAKGEYDTPLGKICVAWKRIFGKIKLSVTIPQGINAELELSGEKTLLTEGNYLFTL